MAKTIAVRFNSNQSAPMHEAAYHVIRYGDWWDVERNGAFMTTVMEDQNIAIRWAIAAAQRELQGGRKVSVCVEEASGHCCHVWP